MNTDLATTLAGVSEGTFVTLAGVPNADDVSQWHVNEMIITQGASGTRRGIVLQAADASPRWLLVTIVENGSEWIVDEFTDANDAESVPNKMSEIDAESIELVSVETKRHELQ